MPDIVYDYSDAPTIKRFSQSRKFLRAIVGPFGSGKSSGCVMEIVQWAARQHAVEGVRRSRFAVVRNTYRQLSDTTIRTWLDWLPEPHFGTYHKTDHAFTLCVPLEDGTRVESEILFRALDRVEHVSNLLSLELTSAWINEAREVPYAIVEALQGRVDRYPRRDAGGAVDPGLILDTNPCDTDSWFYVLFEEKKPHNAELFKQPSGLSPEAENRLHLSPTYYENLAEGKDEDYVNVYIKGQYGFVKEGRAVYPEYNDGLHCVEVEPVPGRLIELGWDFGLTPACIFTQQLPDGRWLVFDELAGDYVGFSTFADCVLEMLEAQYPDFRHESYGDPSGDASSDKTEDKEARTCFDILRGKGFQIAKGQQNLAMRLEAVKYPLSHMVDGRPQFVIHPRCKMLRKGFGGKYQFRRVQVTGSAERYRDEPDKNDFSHVHDALQYVATKLFAHVIKNEPSEKERWARTDAIVAQINKQNRSMIV